eukprot:2302164-Pyramimonas_sp.AAC.3
MKRRVICQIGDCTGSKHFRYGGSVAIAPSVRMVVMPADALPWKVKVLARDCDPGTDGPPPASLPERKRIKVDGWGSQISMTMMSLKINPDSVHWMQKSGRSMWLQRRSSTTRPRP